MYSRDVTVFANTTPIKSNLLTCMCNVRSFVSSSKLRYRIAGKFGGGTFGKLIDQPIDYKLQVLIWMVLVWRITDDSSNSPNFPAIRYVTFYVWTNKCTYFTL